MRILYFDCISGISGDMTVAALRDLGIPEEIFTSALAQLNLPDEFHTHFQRAERQNIAGWKFDVHAHQHSHPHDHAHSHEHSHDHPHTHGRSYRDIRSLLEASSLRPTVKSRALAVFHRIAVAEGKIHGMPPDEVGFHEVGAIDSIVDIVAACAGIDALGVEAVHCSRLFEGTGWIDCAHGRFPLPGPATLEILTGIPLRQIDEPLEFITPTGAALVAEFARSFGPLPESTPQKIGYGLGTRNTTPRPNVLRAILAETTDSAESDTIAEITTNIDDTTPEVLGAAMEALFHAGALDVFFVTAHMKKNRPGTLVTVLAQPSDTERLSKILLTHTSAFGVRITTKERRKLRREMTTVETPYGPVAVKLGYLGTTLVQASPEFDSAQAAAHAHNVPVSQVLARIPSCL